MIERMYKWMDDWMNEWLDEWMDKWKNGMNERLTDGCTMKKNVLLLMLVANQQACNASETWCLMHHAWVLATEQAGYSNLPLSPALQRQQKESQQQHWQQRWQRRQYQQEQMDRREATSAIKLVQKNVNYSIVYLQENSRASSVCAHCWRCEGTDST